VNPSRRAIGIAGLRDSSNEDGIDYPKALFPGSGSMEVHVRVDAIGTKDLFAPGGTRPWSVLFDSRGGLGRRPGDIFAFVEADGRVRFTFNAGIENPVANPVHQVVSTTSILDGLFHTVGISYGVDGMSISIDGSVEDTDPFAMLASSRRFSLADYDEQSSSYPDSSIGFGFEGEVDWIRITEGEPAPAPEPGTLLLLGLAAVMFGLNPARRTF